MHNRSPQPRNSEIPKHILLHLLCKKTKCDSASTSSKKKKKRVEMLKIDAFEDEGEFSTGRYILCSFAVFRFLTLLPNMHG